MYNNNDEMFEVEDFDANITRREELIKEIKELDASTDFNAAIRKVSALKKQWRKIPYGESAYEDKLAEEFESYVDAIYAKRNEGYALIKAKKEEIIEKAKEVSISKEWNKATDKMNALMKEWKEAGSAGKDDDDSLWEEFNEIKQSFYDAKHEFYEELKEKYAEARATKEAIVATAEGLTDSEEWQKTGAKFKELMDEWKAAGNAGKEFDDKLWEAFNNARQAFYERRNAYYEQLHEKQDKCLEEKKALIEKAEGIADSASYTRDNTEAMKALSNDWKKIGYSGKDKEEDIWKQFRSVMDKYFDGLRHFNDQKKEQWRQKLIDSRNKKVEQIANQKRHIKRLEADIVGLLGERAIRETEEKIEDKKEYITRLEAELAELDKSIEGQK